MGCFPSSTRVANAIIPRKLIKHHSEIFSDYVSYTSMSQADASMLYNIITTNCVNIKCPPGMVPVLCLKPEAMPLVTTNPAINFTLNSTVSESANQTNNVFFEPHLENGNNINILMDENSQSISNNNPNFESDENSSIIINNNNNNNINNINNNINGLNNSVVVSPHEASKQSDKKYHHHRKSISKNSSLSSYSNNNNSNNNNSNLTNDPFNLSFNSDVPFSNDANIKSDSDNDLSIDRKSEITSNSNIRSNNSNFNNYNFNISPDASLGYGCNSGLSAHSSYNLDNGYSNDVQQQTIIPPKCINNNINFGNKEVVNEFFNLPIVAVSTIDFGRIYCFSHVQMLAPSLLDSDSTFQLFFNILNFVMMKDSLIAPILFVDPQQRTFPEINNFFTKAGILIENWNLNSKFDRYRILVIVSDMQLNDTLKDDMRRYILRGGTIFCFFNPMNFVDSSSYISTPINEFLRQFGLCYAFSSLSPSLNNLQTVSIPSTFSSVSRANFMFLSDTFIEVVKSPEFDANYLDDIVSNLRYYIIACDDTFSKELFAIEAASFEFLRKTSYRSHPFSSPASLSSSSTMIKKNGKENNVCCELFPEVYHGIIAVIIQDIYQKIPVEQIEKNPDVDIFPGKSQDLPEDEKEKVKRIVLTITPNSLISTGFWVPAGEIVSLNIENKGFGFTLSAQIGSHIKQLYTLPGPWHRWPSVVSCFSIDEGENLIASPFGGILYIVSEDMGNFFNESADNNNNNSITSEFHLTLMVKNATSYPRAVKGRPEIYQNSSKSLNPWGEIESTTVIFTVPSKLLRKIPDVLDLLNHFDSMIIKLTEYMDFSIIRPYRVVFDIDILNDDYVSYPIYVYISDFDSILIDYKNISPAIFHLLEKIALLSIRDQFFDFKTEIALSALAAAVVMKEFYPDFDPERVEGIQLPFLFQEFWEIQNLNEGIFEQIFENSQLENAVASDINEDRWVEFIQNISRFGKRNYTTMFQKLNMVPRNFRESIKRLPEPEIFL